MANTRELVDDLVVANRILFDQAVLDGFGHVSVRDDRNPDRFWLARSMAAGLVTEPSVSLPIAAAHIHVETATAEPELEPDGLRSRA